MARADRARWWRPGRDVSRARLRSRHSGGVGAGARAAELEQVVPRAVGLRVCAALALRLEADRVAAVCRVTHPGHVRRADPQPPSAHVCSSRPTDPAQQPEASPWFTHPPRLRSWCAHGIAPALAHWPCTRPRTGQLAVRRLVSRPSRSTFCRPPPQTPPHRRAGSWQQAAGWADSRTVLRVGAARHAVAGESSVAGGHCNCNWEVDEAAASVTLPAPTRLRNVPMHRHALWVGRRNGVAARACTS